MKKIFILLFLIFSLSTVGFCASNLNVYTTEVEHPLQAITKNKNLPKIKKCGYLDKTSRVVIQPEYQLCSNFKNNQATVMIYGYDTYSDGIYNLYCINPQGVKIHNGACKGFSGLFSEDDNAANELINKMLK
mgnify:CR=1 FL=1